jgi:hypothetical protein
VPAFNALLNLKTGHWTTEMDSSFAKEAPVAELKVELKKFYGEELS